MPRKLITTVVVVSIVFIVTALIAYAQPLHNWLFIGEVEVPASPVKSSAVSSAHATTAREAEVRSLALQPEALKVAKRVGGERFKSRTGSTVVLHGELKTDGDSQHVTVIRRQTDDGEQVEVNVGGRAAMLWARESGPQNLGGGTLSQAERVLLERLTYDSADQFILAQLRGASYSVVVRNLRPDDAGEDYAGPLWDVIRIDDPEPDEQKRPLSTWRLYYINRTTGLIDKVVSEVLGERVETQLSDWTERNGEKFPASITWSRGGQTLMTFNLINVSSASH
jgi:hypothetical protein